MSDSDRVQSVRNAWTNALRAEVLRVGRTIPEVARVASVGVWIATYTDADGSNAFPSRETLALLSGSSQETVTRAVKVLTGVGLLARKRRPNASSVYQLLLPTGPLSWADHMHLYTDTRQRRARREEKERVVSEATRTATADAVRTASPYGVPDSDLGGGSEPPADVPDSDRGRPRTATADTFRTATSAGVYQYPSTSGRDPLPDHNMAGLSPQPQQRAGEAAKDESSTGEGERASAPRDAALAAVRARPALARCTEPDCGIQLPYGATGRCAGCEQYLTAQTTTRAERHSA